MFGLGLRKFSMNGTNIGRVKRTLSLFTLDEAQEIAKHSICQPKQKLLLT